MGTQFLDLPPEITLQIIVLLDGRDVLNVSILNRSLHELVTSDIRIKHRLAAFAAKVVDNPNSIFPIHERIALLKAREDAWLNLAVRRRDSVPIRHVPTGIYDLTGGVYFLGERLQNGHFSVLTRSLRWINLPTVGDESEEKPEWNTLDLLKPISDLGLALHEHDLVAVAFFDVQHVPGDAMRATLSLQIRLIKLSTGQNHPAASQPTLHVHDYNVLVAPPALAIEIVGDKLVVLLAFPYAHRAEQVRIFVWNWKTGHLHYKMVAPKMMYQSFFFLTPDVIVLPNSTEPSLQLYDVTFSEDQKGEAEEPRHLRTLSLPELAPSAGLIRFACRGEPNPMCSTPVPRPQEPFFDSAEDAVVAFNILIQNPGVGPFGRMINITLILHRDALVKWIPGKVSNNDIPEKVPYEQWGPSVTRWFAADNSSTRWITTTCGQRFVSHPRRGGGHIILRDFNGYTAGKLSALIPENDDTPESFEPVPIGSPQVEVPTLPDANVDDDLEDDEGQNQLTEDDMLEDELDAEVEAQLPPNVLSSGLTSPEPLGKKVTLESGNSVRVVMEASVFPASIGAFSKDVVSSLPYVETTSKETYKYTSVLMDEKRIIGLTLDDNDERIVAIDILNFG